jgi:bromodomain adjacent to zinc finger domain protein 1A
MLPMLFFNKRLSSQPLHLSTFSLDEFERALCHSAADQPCSLLAEVHSSLIYNLRTVGFQRHGALLSLLKRKEGIVTSKEEEQKIWGVSIDDLIGAMADVGNNWERVPLRHTEGRDGWEDALVGCLKDVGAFITLGLIYMF